MTSHRSHLLHPPKKLGTSFIRARGLALMKHPLFTLLTIGGNTFIAGGAAVFYYLEKETNPKVVTFLDSLWWAVSTVTTVGYGDIIPVTTAGKIAGMILMIFGTALFSSFTALFASILLEPEIVEVEKEVRELEKSMSHLDK